jgi:outer membrane protein, heavy metal efflux system
MRASAIHLTSHPRCRRLSLGLLAGAAVSLSAGCAGGPLEPSSQPPGTPASSRPPLVGSYEANRPDAATEPQGVLTLDAALAAALLGSPRLAAASYEVRAREAEQVQSRLWLNPELEVEIEEFGGTGELGGFDAAEFSLSLSQTIELGGKRTSRIEAVRQEARLAAWDYELQRIDVFTATAADYIAHLAARRELQAAQQSQQVAERLARAIRERVQAGKTSPVDAAKAQVALAEAGVALARAERLVGATALQLASNWGSLAPKFDGVAGDLDDTAPPPELADLLDRVAESPSLALWSAQLALRDAEVEMALGQRLPDMTVSGGVSHFNETDDQAFKLGLSAPLPLFDRGQEAVRAARLRALATNHLEQAAHLETRTAIALAQQQLANAHALAEALRTEVLPANEASFRAAEQAYASGKTDVLDLLDAERSLLAARREVTAALTEYHLAVIACERLIGAPLHHDESDSGDDQ